LIIVTGGAGFIGSNLIKGLNARGRADILVVDHLKQGHKFENLVDCEIADYWDRKQLLDHINSGEDFPEMPDAVFHQGACTVTTEWDGRYMMETNFDYSKALLHFCLDREIPFLYASSAAVYGTGSIFREERQFEAPLNVYGYSKFLFDQYVRRTLPMANSQVVGLRYFNVYGPREAHKNRMASMAFHLRNQLLATGKVKLFSGSHGYGDGEQRRDFIHVDDTVAVNLWLLDHSDVSGIYNCGTGQSATFNEVARAVINYYGHGTIEYIAFPEDLRGCYQSLTEADLTALHEAGYDPPFLSVEEGIPSYVQWLDTHAAR